MSHGRLRDLVVASSLSVALAALIPGTGLDTLVGSRFLAEAAPAPGADGRAVDPGYAPEVGEWHFNSKTKHYYAQVGGLTWAEAEAYAERLGGHLVTINNRAEQTWLSKTFPGEKRIGMNDRAHEGKWVWSSGEPVTYTNWDPGEPNSCLGCPQGEDIAGMNYISPPYPDYIGWADFPDNGPGDAIIELKTQPTTGWVSGTVTAAGSPVPETGVDALVWDPHNGRWVSTGSATTDAHGAYEIGRLPSTDYRIVFRGGAKFVDQYWPFQSNVDSARTVHVTAGEVVSGIDGAMLLTGAITGLVTDGTNPIADIAVKVEASAPSGWIAGTTARTASDGTYTVAGLAPGAYRVTYEDPERRIPPEVYDNASLENPTPVKVAPGATSGGIDATLELPGPPASEPTTLPSTAGAAGPTAVGPSPAAVGLPKVVAITAGQYHYCLLGDDGSVWCWGGNGFGELGLGAAAATSTRTPGRVEGIPEGVRQVVAFGVQTCALTENGGAWCWGDNRSGELGDGTKEARSVPTPVRRLGSGVAAFAQSAGATHTCALLADGSGACWGDNWAGQLGDGTTDERLEPVTVSATNEKLDAVVAMTGTTCAVTDRGAVRCWGSLWLDPAGKTEEGSVTGGAAVTPLGLGAGVRSLTAAGDYACALLESGEVRCWSWGWDSPADVASSPWYPGPVPEAVAGLPGGMETVQLTQHAGSEAPGSQVIRVAISACATRGDRAWCWDDNHWGQLGDGTMVDRASPVQVQTGDIAQLSLGNGSGLALLRDGSLVMWGAGDPAPRSPFSAPATPATTSFREPDTLVPAITTHIPTPADISTDPPVVGANLLLAALAMIAFTVATELLNRSLGQVEPLLARRFRPIGRLDRARARLDAALIGRFGGAGHARRANALRILGIAAFYGIVFALLDPTWNPLTVTGLWLVLIMAVAFGLIGLSGDISSWAAARRWGIAGELAVKPGSLVAAVSSTLFSRAFVLVPGVMIGSPEALEIDEERVDRRRLGGLAGVGLGTILAVGLVAWLATLGTTALRGNGATLDVALGGAEAFLLLVFAAAVQNGFVQLLSVRESAGRALRRTHRIAWAIALLGVTFAFWHTLVNPRGNLAAALGATNVQAFLATVGVVLAFAVVVWAATYAARRRAARAPSSEAVAFATDSTPPPLAPPVAASQIPVPEVEASVMPGEVAAVREPTVVLPPAAASPAGAVPFDATPASVVFEFLEPPLFEHPAPTLPRPSASAEPGWQATGTVSSERMTPADAARSSSPPGPRFCTQCGAPRRETDRFCRTCGLDLAAAAPPIPASPSDP